MIENKGGFWFFVASIPLSAAIAICGAGSCIARSDQATSKAREEYYRSRTEVIKAGIAKGIYKFDLNY